MKYNIKVTGICNYLVNPEGVALFPFPPNASVANTDIPEALSLQLPVVCPRGKGLDGEDLRPVVESFRVGGAGQALWDPHRWLEVIRDAQQRVCSVGVQGQRTGHWMRGKQTPVKPGNRLDPRISSFKHHLCCSWGRFDELWNWQQLTTRGLIFQGDVFHLYMLLLFY